MARVFHREHAAGCHPDIQRFLDWWEKNGPFPVTVPPDGGVRTDAEQSVLYARGRTTPGPHAGEKGYPPLGQTVTKAAVAHDTPHGRGAAVDLLPVQLDAEGLRPIAIIDHDWRLFEVIGVLARGHGLDWGGDFPKGQKDGDHVQLHSWRTLSTSEVQNA